MGIGKKIFLMPCMLFAMFFAVNINADQAHENARCEETVSVVGDGLSRVDKGAVFCAVSTNDNSTNGGFVPPDRSAEHSRQSPPYKPEIVHKMKKLQMPFIANDGQADENVKYYANTFAGSVFVTKEGEIVYSLPKNNEVTDNFPLKRGAGGVSEHTQQNKENDGFASSFAKTQDRLNPSYTNSNPQSEIKNLKSKTQGLTLKEELVNSKISQVKGEGESGTKVSYFKGNDPAKWKNDISTYDLVDLGEVYKGIDLKLKAYGNNVEKLFTVKPGADAGQIKIRLEGIQPPESSMTEETQPPESPFIKGDLTKSPLDFVVSAQSNEKGAVGTAVKSPVEKGVKETTKKSPLEKGARGLSVNEQGELVVKTALGDVKFSKPVAYQEIDGKKVNVDVKYSIQKPEVRSQRTEDGRQRREVRSEKQEARGKRQISSREKGMGRKGVYLTFNSQLPTENVQHETQNSSLATRHTSHSIYSFKVASYDTTKDLIIDPLLASTFLGGHNADYATSMVIDKSGNIYVTGWTTGGVPTTDGAYKSTYNGGNEDVFVSKFNGDLSQLLASTYIGGSARCSWCYERSTTITVDNDGNIFVGGHTSSNDFPTTDGAFDTSFSSTDGFISKLSGDLTQLLASTYLGGAYSDVVTSIVTDVNGNIYVTGGTEHSDFPVTPGAYNTAGFLYYNAFVSKLSGDLTKIACIHISWWICRY